MGIEVSSSRISLCLQPSRKERKPCSSWLWEKNINTLPGKLSGKGLGSRHRSSFHPVISAGGATVTANEKGYARGKMFVSQAGQNSCSSDAMPEPRGMKHLWKWLFPAAHHVCQREEGKKAGIISQERSCWFWFVCIFRTRLYVWGFECEPTEWFISLTILFHHISKHPPELPVRAKRVNLISRGWRCSLKHPQQKWEISLQCHLTLKKSMHIFHSIRWYPHICCKSKNHLTLPLET